MIKNLTELDIDLIDSNEAMLVLNNLPNVLKLNGRNTKDDDDEEEDNGEGEEFIDTLKNNNEIDNHNIINHDNININNVYNNEINNRNDYLHPQMEEIEEDKNLENNSNYVSSDNNNDNNILNNFNSYGAANEKEKTNGSKKMTRNIKILKEKEFSPKIGENNIESNTDGIFQPNSLLYNKIIANNSNKKNANLNKEQNIDIDADDKKIEKEKESIFDLNNINSNNSDNFLIDISNEELNLLRIEKYNKNSEFISFMKDFCEMINNEDYESSDGNRIQNNYLSKIKSINDKKGEIPNYYYFFLLQKKKIKMIQNMFSEILPYILNKCPELNKNNNLVKLTNELFNTIKDTKELINYLHSHIEEYNEKKGNENNTNDLIKEKDDKISSLEELNNKLLLKLKNIKEEQSEYERKLSNLEKENKLMTERILTKANTMINYSMTETQNTVTATERGTTTKSKITNNSTKNNTSVPKTNKRLFFNNEILNTNFVNYYHPTGKTSPIKLSENTTTLENMTTPPNYYLNTYGNNNNNNSVKQHLISLKTLKDFINELYASKTEYDIKCYKFKLPRETLEEHMYTFLNKKYGLKNLIIEWAKNVITGIKYYSKKDSIVLLFGKIMRNEQEEDARFIIRKVSESIEELLLYYIKKQNPLKLFNEIKEIFEQKKKSELMEEEWKGIIYSIYEKEEAGEIEKKIESFINKETEKKKMEMLAKYKKSRIIKKNNNNNYKYNFNSNTGNTSYYLNTINSVNNSTNLHNKASNNSSYMNSLENINNNKLTRIEKYNMLLMPEERNILYTDFIKIVLDNHIRFRDKQLMNFVKLFKSVDTDKDGVINEEEFTELIQKMKIFKEEEVENRIIQYLGKIDPFDNQRITFSECVSFFSNEIITNNDINGNEKEISILEKVCFNINTNGKSNNEVNNNETNDNIPLMESAIDSNKNINMPLNKNVDSDNK